MIRNLIFGAYLLISDFLAESLKANKKQSKKITHFTMKFRSKKLIHFMNLTSLNIAKNILSQHNQKPDSLDKLSSKHVSGWFQKKHLHCNISRSPRIVFSKDLESKCQYIPVYLCKKIFVPET